MILTFKIKKRFSAAIIGLNADVKINAFFDMDEKLYSLFF